MKKIISIILCQIIVLSSISVYAENVYDLENDISSMWYENYFGDDTEENSFAEQTLDDSTLNEIESIDEDQGESQDTNVEQTISLASNTYTGWKSCGTMTSERSYMSSVVINDDIYTFGGSEDSDVTNKTEVYDTATEVWSRKTAMPQARYKHTALVNGNKVYICGGYDEENNGISSIDVYNQLTDSWEESIYTPNVNTCYGSGIYNGELYIFGGKEDEEAVQKIYKYNLETNGWSFVGEDSHLGIDNIVLSSYGGFRIINNWKIYQYNINDELVEIDEVPRHVYDYATVNIVNESNNIMYVVGGRDKYNTGVSITNVKYRNDLDTSNMVEDWIPEWYNDLRLIRGLACHNVVVANGNMYVLGGQIEYGQDQKLMFKRDLNDISDDYPDDQQYTLTRYVYGSINDDGDIDKFIFTPSVSGYYKIECMDAIHSNNKTPGKYGFDLFIKESEGTNIIDVYYANNFGGIYMEEGKTYDINIFESEGVIRGNYMYQITKIEDDLPDALSDAVEISLEEEIDKNYCGVYDTDCMKFTIPISGEYDIRVENHILDSVTYTTQSNIKIYNENQKEIYSFSAEPTAVKNYMFNAGTYYIELKTKGLTYYDTSNSEYTLSIKNTSIYGEMYNKKLRHNGEVVDGNLYIIGGLNNDFDENLDIEQYMPSTHLWTKVNAMLEGMKDASTSVVGKRIYTFGGYADGVYSNSIKYYDTDQKQWNTSGSLITARGRATCIANEESIYIIGGRNTDGYLNSIEIFDTQTNSITNTILLPEAIIEPQAFYHNDTLYIVGGITYDGYSDKVYALEDGEWIQKTSMPYVSEYVRGDKYENDFFCGAVNNSGNVDILQYDPESDIWNTWEENFIEGLIYYGFDIMNTNIYITGGYSTLKDTAINNVYVCDCVTDTAEFNLDIPVRSIGYEYEQQNIQSIVENPEILGVNVKIINAEKGIYEFTLDEDSYECDQRVIPFFFWSSREGMFKSLSDDYRKVKFYADPNTGDRQVKIIVGIGDGKGYVDKKAFYLTGNSDTE